MDALIVYFLVVVVSIGLVMLVFYRMSNSIADLGSKLTGIWANESNTLCILIYSRESRFRAEVVWTRNSEVNLLGADVIRNLDLSYFSGQGTYIDPFTKHQFALKMKFKNARCLLFHLFEKSGRGPSKVEAWKLVKE